MNLDQSLAVSKLISKGLQINAGGSSKCTGCGTSITSGKLCKDCQADKSDVKAGGPGSGRKAMGDAGKLLTAFGFQKGQTIKQSPTNIMTVYHGKGPNGAPQNVAITPTTFSHIENPGTKNSATVLAKEKPLSGLKEHMVDHWTSGGCTRNKV
jgi:hypothetical protein